MEVAGCLVRWAGHSMGRILLLVGVAAGVYQLYRQWRLRRALRQLAGQVVLITGASSGLGEALARVFHSAGAKLVLASRNVQQLQRLKFQLDNDHVLKPSSPPHHSPKVVPLDLSDPASLPQRVQEVLGAFGRVDILINNAGISSRSSVLETDMAVDRRVMEVNFFGTVALTKALLPSMLEQGCGHIVVIGSIQGKIGLPNRSSYCASKHALQGYFDSLRVEFAPRGVAVTMVSPGYISTQLSANAVRGDGSKHGVTDTTTARGMTPEHAAQQILHVVAIQQRDLLLATPLHRAATYLQLLYPALLDWMLQLRAKVT